MASINKKNKANTLIIISPGFPSDESDSTCLPAIQSIVRTLNQVYPKLNITIVSLQYPNRTGHYTWYGNDVHPVKGKVARVLRPFVWARVTAILFRIASGNNVKGVLSLWCQESALLGKYFARWIQQRHLIWLHGQDAAPGNSFVRWIQPLADELIALSGFLADEFKRNYGIHPRHLIQNGINPDLVRVDSTERTIDILGAGSLIPLKRFDVFIEIVRSLQEHKKDLNVKLIGAGPEEARLRSRVEEYGLQSTVSFEGILAHHDVLEQMKRAKILLHPSSYEGYSTVSAEALYCGCHVISFTYPEKKQIPQWHIVRDHDEMISKCREILDNKTDHSSVLVNDLRIEAKKLMQLFGYRETME
jgi:glycosyltransferase involved in cell wall biosynthesis